MIDFTNITDESLIDILKKEENERYFSVLIERYDDFIYKKCLAFVRQPDLAKDLSQEIRIKLFLQLHTFKEASRFSTWLYSIIYHTCVDFLRKDKKKHHQMLTEKLIDQLSEEIEEENDLDFDLMMNTLMELMDQLKEEEKLLLLMKYKERYSIHDIQNTLGLSEGTIKMRLLRSKEKLNKLYQIKLNR